MCCISDLFLRNLVIPTLAKLDKGIASIFACLLAVGIFYHRTEDLSPLFTILPILLFFLVVISLCHESKWVRDFVTIVLIVLIVLVALVVLGLLQTMYHDFSSP